MYRMYWYNMGLGDRTYDMLQILRIIDQLVYSNGLVTHLSRMDDRDF